ncbi:O-antigen ligase family protein [Aeromonas veronii]|uniref:O-antigen ligase family protein n=1 Tax=Aeromonas TaxID=642 RepID=UPI0013E052F3|nr:O-antigen ligase family protein [Aeromonas veronii]QIF43765.1 hypothetical protein EO082_06810 [Aeromonas veronii]
MRYTPTLSLLLIKITIYIIIPALLLAHGIIWHHYNVSSPEIIYAMKLSYILVLVGMLWHIDLKFSVSFSLIDEYIFFGFTVILLSSLIAPFVSEVGTLRYTISDFIGFALIPIYYVTAINFICHKSIGIDEFIVIVINATFFSSLSVLFMYIYTSGAKVSIPPELHFGGALAIAYLIFNFNIIRFPILIKIIIIMAACVFSLQRINIIVLVIPIMLFVLMNVFNVKKILAIIAFVILTSFSFYLVNGDAIVNVISSFSFDLSDSSLNFHNSSANQRLIEISLILRELSSYDWYTYLIGKGFGAEYHNYMNAVPHYDEVMHHAHSSPFLIMLRNGILGVAFIFTIPIFFISRLTNKNISAIVISGLISTYIALLVDQYIYWGALFAISLALCSSVFKMTKVR